MSFYKKEIHRIYDEYGPIQVMEEGKLRYMTFGNDVEQSCQLTHQPHLLQHEYTRAILLVLLMHQPSKITVVGLGGGCLITTLLHLLPKATIEAIELRKSVAEVAHDYFQMPKTDRLTVHIEDGFQFLSNTKQQKSDLIIADMYTADGIDHQQLSINFLKTSQQKLNQGGWLVLNYWLKHKLEEHLVQALLDHFNHVYLCNAGGGNWVIFAGNEVDVSKPIIDEAKEKSLSKLAGFSLNKYINRLTVLN